MVFVVGLPVQCMVMPFASTSWWWYQHSNALLVTEVSPPSAQWVMAWWTSHRDGG